MGDVTNLVTDAAEFGHAKAWSMLDVGPSPPSRIALDIPSIVIAVARPVCRRRTYAASPEGGSHLFRQVDSSVDK